MKDYLKQTYRPRVRTGMCVAPVVQSIQSSSRQLSVVADVTNGNHVTPNRHSYNKYSYFYPDGRQSWESKGICQSYVWSGPQVVALNNGLLAPDAKSEVYNRALSKLYAKVRGDLDLSISFFERQQTVAMLRSLRKLTTYVQAVNPKNWGNNWLMWQYGIRPLVNDFYAVSKKLVAGDGLYPVHVRTRASQVTTKDDIYNYPYPGVPQRRHCDASYRCMFDVVFKFKPSALQSVAGWSSLNPISIAWELLPYSFVVDWVYNVGGYIRNTENALLYGQSFNSGYYTETQKIHQTSRLHGGWSDAQGSGYVDCDFVAITSKKSRVVLSTTPFPRPPSFKVDLGSSQILSAAALIAQPLQKLGKIGTGR